MRRRRVYVQCEVLVTHREGQARQSGARLSKEIVGQSIAEGGSFHYEVVPFGHTSRIDISTRRAMSLDAVGSVWLTQIRQRPSEHYPGHKSEHAGKQQGMNNHVDHWSHPKLLF